MINSWYFRCYEKDVIAHTESISSNTVNPSNINSYGKYSYILFFKMKHQHTNILVTCFVIKFIQGHTNKMQVSTEGESLYFLYL